MLIDEAEIILKAGHGGAGKVSFRPMKGGGPDGGNGGKGGNVYIQATTDLTALRPFTHKKVISAQNGQGGSSNKKFGLHGADITVTLPIGSILIDKSSKEVLEITHPDQKILICQGGLGGRGNFEFKSPRNTTPLYAQPGLPGEQKEFSVSLKLIADFGIIGLPNSGKSSLLNELTSAQAKIGGYPFTTLEPNLGTFKNLILADIPGLIEGASSGKGLGIKFLKHIEKTKILLHCISADSQDPLKDYQVIKAEMEKYNPTLNEKAEIILITKSDTTDPKTLKKLKTSLKKTKKTILEVSIYDYDSIEKLKKLLSPSLQ